MTTLHLIRHGRASAGAEDYDRLSPEGLEQSALLGAHLSSQAQRFDRVYCGPLLRQRQTLQEMRRAAGAHAEAWPEAETLDGLAEAPLDAMAKVGLSDLLARDAELRTLVEGLANAEDAAAQMLRVFHHFMRLWIRGQWEVEGFEGFEGFRARVLDALAHITAASGGAEHVAVVTSNGVIGCMVDHVHGADALDPDYAVPAFHNSSITQLLVVDGRLSVGSSNQAPHLPERLRSLL